MNQLPRHGFSRWDVVPESDEGAAQFFRRMVSLEGEDNIAYFNALNGLKDTSLDPLEALGFLMRHPFPDHVKAHLLNSATYDVEKDFHAHRSMTRTLRGEDFKRNDLVAYRRRWCPACVAEKPYMRLWFDVAAIGRCPYHDLPMRDGIDLPWYRASLAGLADHDSEFPSRRLKEGTFAHYVLGRLGCEEVVNDELLDHGTIGDVIAACAVVGIMMSRDWQSEDLREATPEEIEVGFQKVRLGSSELVTAIHVRMVDQVPAAALAGNAEDIFGWAYARTSNACGVLGQRLRDAMRSALAAHRIGTLRPVSASGMLSLRDLAKRYGLRDSCLSKLLKDEDIIEAYLRRRRPIIESQLREIDALVGRLVDPDEFSRLLGLPRGAHRHFVQAGLIRQYRGRVFGRLGPFFRHADIATILDRLTSIPRGGQPEFARSFLNAARKAHVAPGAMAVKVMKGEVGIIEVKDAAQGFRGLVVRTKEPLRRKPRLADDELIMLTEVISILGIAKTTARALVKGNHLRSVDSRAGRLLFKRTDVEAFARSHVCEYPLRKATGISPSVFAARMKAAGVRPILKFDDKEVHNTIYVRTEVLAALSLDADPLAFSDPAVDRFWSEVTDRVAREMPTLRLPSMFPQAGCWAATVYRPRFAKFTFDTTARVMVINLAPMGEAAMFEFEVDQFDPDFDLAHMFKVFRATSTLQVAKRSLAARERRRRRGSEA